MGIGLPLQTDVPGPNQDTMLFVTFIRCIVYPLTALVITVVNGVEIWFIANRYRRTVNPLLVFVKTLSIVDLLIGVNFFVRVSVLLFTRVPGKNRAGSPDEKSETNFRKKSLCNAIVIF